MGRRSGACDRNMGGRKSDACMGRRSGACMGRNGTYDALRQLPYFSPPYLFYAYIYKM